MVKNDLQMAKNDLRMAKNDLRMAKNDLETWIGFRKLAKIGQTTSLLIDPEMFQLWNIFWNI